MWDDYFCLQETKQGKCPLNNYPKVHLFCKTQVTWLRVRCSSGYLDKPCPSAPTMFHSIEGKQRSPGSPHTIPLLFLTATCHQNSCLNLPLTSKWAAMLANLRFPCPPSFPWPLSDAPHNHLSPQRSYPCLLHEPPVLCDDIQPVLEIEAQSPKCLFHITMLCLICPSILPQKSQNILFHYWHTHELIFLYPGMSHHIATSRKKYRIWLCSFPIFQCNK